MALIALGIGAGIEWWIAFAGRIGVSHRDECPSVGNRWRRDLWCDQRVVVTSRYRHSLRVAHRRYRDWCIATDSPSCTIAQLAVAVDAPTQQSTVALYCEGVAATSGNPDDARSRTEP